jgi:hypothetical protein
MAAEHAVGRIVEVARAIGRFPRAGRIVPERSATKRSASGFAAITASCIDCVTAERKSSLSTTPRGASTLIQATTDGGQRGSLPALPTRADEGEATALAVGSGARGGTRDVELPALVTTGVLTCPEPSRSVHSVNPAALAEAPDENPQNALPTTKNGPPRGFRDGPELGCRTGTRTPTSRIRTCRPTIRRSGISGGRSD